MYIMNYDVIKMSDILLIVYVVMLLDVFLLDDQSRLISHISILDT